MTALPGPVLVVIPTYDERENIELIVERVRRAVPPADILVVDDDSPDGTGKVADELAEADSHVHVLHRAGKGGLGAAYIAGFGWGLDRRDDAGKPAYGVLVEMDADGSHKPEQLPDLLAGLGSADEPRADLVLGSRWVPGGAVVNWHWARRLISRGGSLYSRLALGVPVKDVTGGYRAFRREVLEGIGYAGVESQGYCFQIDLAARALRAGYRVVEVPITFVERERGESKMSGGIVREALIRVTHWGLEYRRAQLRRLFGRPS